jgi:signal transduction histidine kinase
MESLHLTEIVKKVVDDIHIKSQEKSIKLDVQIPFDIPRVLADRKALDEVFSNLLFNAVKYTKERGSIYVTVRKKGRNVEVDISDTGIGIAQEYLTKICDEFFRAPSAKSHIIEGTGIGLAIVKEIVKAHYGSVTVQSEVGKGTTFTVSLPVYEKLDNT